MLLGVCGGGGGWCRGAGSMMVARASVVESYDVVVSWKRVWLEMWSKVWTEV